MLKSLKFIAVVSGLTFFVTPCVAQNVKPDIVDEWPAHTAFLLMLGGQNRILSANLKPSASLWARRYFPQDALYRAQSGESDVESFLARGAKIAFLPSGRDDAARQWNLLGLRAYSYPARDFAHWIECVARTAEILDSDTARARSSAYTNRLNDLLRHVPTLPVKPRVLHIAALSPLLADGRNTLIDAWIEAAGGVNVAKSVNGNRRSVGWEDLLAWNPDLVILEADAGRPEDISNDAGRAFFKNHRIVRNPTGVFPWDRYGPEALLQIEWARDLFTKDDIDRNSWIERVRDFYRTYYRTEVSREDAARMLNGDSPAP